MCERGTEDIKKALLYCWEGARAKAGVLQEKKGIRRPE